MTFAPKMRHSDELVAAVSGMYRVEWSEEGNFPELVPGGVHDGISGRHFPSLTRIDTVESDAKRAVPLFDLAKSFIGKPFISVIVVREHERFGVSPNLDEYFVDTWTRFTVGFFDGEPSHGLPTSNLMLTCCRADATNGSEIRFEEESPGAHIFNRAHIGSGMSLFGEKKFQFVYVGDEAVRAVLSTVFCLSWGTRWVPEEANVLKLLRDDRWLEIVQSIPDARRKIQEMYNDASSAAKKAQEGANTVRERLAYYEEALLGAQKDMDFLEKFL